MTEIKLTGIIELPYFNIELDLIGLRSFSANLEYNYFEFSIIYATHIFICKFQVDGICQHFSIWAMHYITHICN